MEYKQITFEVINQIARIGFGKYSIKPMTTLELDTMEELETALEEIVIKQNKDIMGLIFFSHKKNVFLAGMNVSVIRDLKTVDDGIKGAQHGQKIYNQIEDLLIPSVACVDGVCFGGGFELSLACKTIVVSDSPYTVLGAPEVTLGLLPGFGGSYRLPRRLGLPDALDLILSGRSVKGSEAKKMGLVDQVYPKEKLLEMAISNHMAAYKEEVGQEDSIHCGETDSSPDKKSIFKRARESVLKETKGQYEAPLRILDLWESSLNDSRPAYLKKEAQLLGELAVSEQSRHLQNIYFLHAHSQQYRGPGGDKGKLILKRGAVVGAGTMGGGIVWLMAGQNMAPILKDINAAGLESGLKQAEMFFAEALKRKKTSKDKAKREQASIKAQLDYHGFKNIDLVAEAVHEDMETKKGIFSEIEKEVNDNCLITSNTLSLSVNELASALVKPERFAGLHFFNPLNRVPLVEIITHDQIAAVTISALYEWAVRAKKIPVVVKDGPGFLINRILAPFLNEALYLLEEGVPLDALEQACINFGLTRGPCYLLDEMGTDVAYKIVNKLNDVTEGRYKPAAIYEKFADLNCYGKKSKKGFFHYDEQGRKTGPNKDILNLLPVRKINMGEKDIQKRVVLPMINEAARLLQNQVAGTVEEIDLGLVFGAGFPRFRGGLLKYADSLGVDTVLKGLDQYAEDIDRKRFEACSFMREMVKMKETFYH